MSERKLAAWREAGLIDDETVARILAHEEQHARPLALWAAIGIGALAIGLGLISLIAANWEDVPGLVRLALHMALLVGLGAFIATRANAIAGERPWVMEAALFVFAALGLTFFGHIGQVYQTSSPLWKPLAAWLALFGPLMLLRGRGWLIAATVFAGFAYTCFDYVSALERAGDLSALEISLVTALPALFAPLGAFLRGRSARGGFWRTLEQLGLAYAVGAASIMAIAAGMEDFANEPEFLGLTAQFVRLVIALVAAAIIAVARPTISGRMTAAIMAGCGLTVVLAYALSGSELLPGVLFMALWAGIATAALSAGWRGVFQLAVAVVALRLIILSFELASDLLTSGFGLIISGLLILAIAWGALRITRRFAPSAEGQA